jgi:hypothetical protein
MVDRRGGYIVMFQRLAAVATAAALPVATIARWWIVEAASHFPPPGGGGYLAAALPVATIARWWIAEAATKAVATLVAAMLTQSFSFLVPSISVALPILSCLSDTERAEKGIPTWRYPNALRPHAAAIFKERWAARWSRLETD